MSNAVESPRPTVAITGAGSGLGRAMAIKLAAKGYRVFRLTSTGKRVLVSTLSASTTSTKIAGLPLNTKFIIEAYSGSQVADSDPAHL